MEKRLGLGHCSKEVKSERKKNWLILVYCFRDEKSTIE